MTREATIQNRIRNALTGVGTFLRVNVGKAWTGDRIEKRGTNVLIEGARPFSSGLPRGVSDLIGFVPVVITEEMVGRTVAVFTAVEVKSEKGRLTEQQEAFLLHVREHGGIACVGRSPEGVLAFIRQHS